MAVEIPASRRNPLNRSVRELNNKNNLASLKLRKELAGFDREQRFLLEHIDKNRVSTYSFLKKLKHCESNLVPAYNELIQGIVSRPSMARRLRKVHTAPALGANTENKDEEKSFVPKLTKAQIDLLQSQKDVVSNQDRADVFLRRLRERHRAEQAEEAEEEHLEPEIVLSRRISKMLSVQDPEDHQERWAGPRGSSFQAIERATSIVSRHRPSETYEVTLPALPNQNTVKTREFRVSVTSPKDGIDHVKQPVPLQMRLKEFNDHLEVLKRRQEARRAELPIWEKRRRWIMLTKGIGAALAESDSESDDENTYTYNKYT